MDSRIKLLDQDYQSQVILPKVLKERHNKDCIKFLSYAKGSCGELRCQIYIGMDIDYIPKEVGKKWVQETIEITSMLSGLIKTKRGFLKSTLALLVAFVL